jgi:outer membrane lipoprotein SlyB
MKKQFSVPPAFRWPDKLFKLVLPAGCRQHVLLAVTIFFALAIAGCNKNSGGAAPSAPPSTSAATQEKTVYLGELELSKITPVQVTIEETNVCTITTMALPGGILNLDFAIEPKGGAVSHASVTTHDGQQFNVQVGGTTVSYTAKLKEK